MKSFQIILALSFLFQSGCGDFSSKPRGASGGNSQVSELPAEFFKPNQGSFTETKMLSNLISNVFIPAADQFQIATSQLSLTIQNYCGSLKSEDEVSYWIDELARDFRRSIQAFHQVDAVPFGPYTANNRRIADTIYAWPLLNSCGLDQQTLALASGSSIDITENLLNLRGLGAIEYLLFEKSLMTKCNARAFPKLQEWNQQTDLQKKQQRCELAVLMAQDVQQKAQELKAAWNPESGNFVKQLVGGQMYRTNKDAVNALTDAALNIDRLKDERLARPLGRYRTCLEESCPQDVEHLHSGLSLLAVETQLKTFQKLFYGSDQSDEFAFGFDDMLKHYGHADLANRLRFALEKATKSVRDLQKNGKTLQAQILEMDPAACKRSTMENREVEVCSVHADVREVGSLFKTELLLALSLRAPASHQGDND